jgi:hypothetical protein
LGQFSPLRSPTTSDCLGPTTVHPLSCGNRQQAKDATPPVNGFWSLTLCNQHHFFEPNEIKSYSVGTKNKTLKYNADGSLMIYVQADPPAGDQRANWLPAPKQGDFSLYVRAYWPKVAVIDGSWTPPPVKRVSQ